jgi:integrase
MASIRQRGDTWQARVTRKGFPKEARTFRTKADAARWCREIEASMDRGTHQRQRESEEVLFRDLLQRYANEISPTKRGSHEELIRIRALMRSRLAAHEMANVTPELVAQFRDARLRAVKAGAVIRDLSLISSIINHARREWGLTIGNPCELVRKPSTPPGRTRVLVLDEEARLVDAVRPVGRRNPLMMPLVQLALETAMRRGELLRLRWEHIDLDRRTALLPVTKNGRSRVVPLSTKAIAVLASIPRSEDGRVFPITAAAMEAAFHKACVRAGIGNLRFHDLRHTATSRMASKLPNVIELAAVTGHQTIQMLKRYYHPDASALATKLG